MLVAIAASLLTLVSGFGLGTLMLPVFALFYGSVFLSEAITPWMIGCGVIILLGTSLSTGLLRLWR